jgi:hypothetical protein
VPGFWVAPVHLETNPAVHLKARKAKFLRGIAELSGRGAGGRVQVRCADAIGFLRGLSTEGIAADVVFLDPPYGDSVPYLEFSAVWNAFLRAVPAYEREIVVSGRVDFPAGWDEYGQRLRRLVEESAAVLRAEGKLLVTFNNLDCRAWFALLTATTGSGLRCTGARYQAPAVVSAKAQFSPKNSYQGDFYCVFERGGTPVEDPDHAERVVREEVADCGECAPEAFVKRQAILSILKRNLSPDILLRLDRVLAEKR